jgi:O-antigen ligase
VSSRSGHGLACGEDESSLQSECPSYLKGHGGKTMQTALRIEKNERYFPAVQAIKRLSPLRFFLRYPIFLLAFGPPQFKHSVAGDTSQAHFDMWNVIQVGWLALIALRAIIRLAALRSIHIPKQSRSILKYAFFLGLLFLGSIAYSPGRIVSAEYCFLYFLNLICVVEFIADVYRNPPNWMQCIFQLRLVAFILFAIVLATLLVDPSLVIPAKSVRLLGGSVAGVGLICPTMVIISAYCLLYSLESRIRSVAFILVGVAGTLAGQIRGADLSLLAFLAVISIGWARKSRRSALIMVSGVMVFVLLAGVTVASIGGDRIWEAFNRGTDISSLETASGRTGVWEDQIEYCLTHPWGMGYIAGVRTFQRSDFATNLHDALNNVGGTDNAYVQVLTDAGWLALAVYLVMLVKIVRLGWRISRKSSSAMLRSNSAAYHAIQCALLLLSFLIVEGMESPASVLPMQQAFYFQNIFIVVILGVSSSMLVASRVREPSRVHWS